MKRPADSPDRRRHRGNGGDPTGDAGQPARFIPNLRQLQEALRHLPEPDRCQEEQFQYRISSGGRHEYLTFARTPIQRGNRRTFRWIYEGKLLIRKRDIDPEEKD